MSVQQQVRAGEEPPASAVPGPDVGGLGQALLVTLVSVFVPGLAHLRGGRTRTGTVLLLSAALGLTGLVLAAAVAGGSLAALAVSPGWLLTFMIVGVAWAAAWALLIVRSYAAVRPARLGPAAELAGGTAVAVLCLLVAVPPLALARYGQVQRDVVTTVFQASAPEPLPRPSGSAGTARPPGSPRAGDPLGGVARLNLLLLGGDADTGRPGVRTDSMTLASVDTRTGATVLLSLPRNLQHVPVWDGDRRVPFPRAGLLNAVYQQGVAHPGALRGHRRPGAELLKRTIGHILGIPVHYYGLVDMRSFRQIVEAMGGVDVCVDRPVPVPREQVAAGVIRKGCRHLTGRQALWFGRSRTGSSDYSRMSRQKCLLWAISRQATPLTVLRSFQRLATVFKASVHTDLPRDLLPRLVGLSALTRTARVTSLQFIPPLVGTANPDFVMIRRLTSQVLNSDSGKIPFRDVHNLGRTCS
ncbi:LCP family protein [Actinocorallia longicatena]|uniref:Cell envelope-related transcriptional attenuator domain-containing protein n=1 Tax=Actinocorallia longicatena TaxID=111803 RepID=A0ABP6Q434_9ACTN